MLVILFYLPNNDIHGQRLGRVFKVLLRAHTASQTWDVIGTRTPGYVTDPSTENPTNHPPTSRLLTAMLTWDCMCFYYHPRVGVCVFVLVLLLYINFATKATAHPVARWYEQQKASGGSTCIWTHKLRRWHIKQGSYNVAYDSVCTDWLWTKRWPTTVA